MAHRIFFTANPPRVLTVTAGAETLTPTQISITVLSTNTLRLDLGAINVLSEELPVTITLVFGADFLLDARFVLTVLRAPLNERVHLPVLGYNPCATQEFDWCEPNDTLSQAFDWDGRELTATLTLTRGAAPITLSVAGYESGDDPDLYVYDVNGALVCRSTFFGTQTESVSFNTPDCTLSPSFADTPLGPGTYIALGFAARRENRRAAVSAVA